MRASQLVAVSLVIFFAYCLYERVYEADAHERTPVTDPYEEALHVASPVGADGRLVLTSLQGMRRYMVARRAAGLPTSVLSVIDKAVIVLDADVPHLHIHIKDAPDANLAAHLADTTEFIRAQLADETRHVVVHCRAGISRSATVVMAYLMATHGMSQAEAAQAVAAVRSFVAPNPGFVRQLAQWEEALRTAK